MLVIFSAVRLSDHEIELNTIRTQGAGGQDVNKVSSVVHSRFGVQASPLPPFYKERLLTLNSQRISGDGVMVIKAQQYRTQEQNREDALEHLAELIRNMAKMQKARRPAESTRGSQKRRLDGKAKHGAVKIGRSKVDF